MKTFDESVSANTWYTGSVFSEQVAVPMFPTHWIRPLGQNSNVWYHSLDDLGKFWSPSGWNDQIFSCKVRKKFQSTESILSSWQFSHLCHAWGRLRCLLIISSPSSLLLPLSSMPVLWYDDSFLLTTQLHATSAASVVMFFFSFSLKIHRLNPLLGIFIIQHGRHCAMS